MQQLVRLRAVASVWNHLRMVLQWVCFDLTVIIKKTEKRKGAIMIGDDNHGSMEMRTTVLSKQMKKQKGLWYGSWSDILGRSHLLSEVIYLSQRSLVVYYWRSVASRLSWRILSLKCSVGVGFQLCWFWTSLVVNYVLRMDCLESHYCICYQ